MLKIQLTDPFDIQKSNVPCFHSLLLLLRISDFLIKTDLSEDNFYGLHCVCVVVDQLVNSAAVG